MNLTPFRSVPLVLTYFLFRAYVNRGVNLKSRRSHWKRSMGTIRRKHWTWSEQSPWAVLVLRKNVFPKDLTSALAALDPAPAATGYSKQQSFFVSESGSLPVAATVAREFRMVISRGQPKESSPAILISAPTGRRDGFIELMSWDPTKKAFNFYRRSQGTEWVVGILPTPFVRQPPARPLPGATFTRPPS